MGGWVGGWWEGEEGTEHHGLFLPLVHSMKCKCGHSFCWKCMKPWKPTHTDYYNCTSKVSKAAADHRRFADYNQRCTSHHKSKVSNVHLVA